MDATLIERWTEGLDELVPVLDEASLTLAREAARRAASRAGLSTEGAGELALVVTELARNQLRHARLGRLGVRLIERDGVKGVELVAADRGAGIADPEAALAGVARSRGSLGVGLSSVLRLSFEVDIDVRVGAGTVIVARRFGGPVPRRREVGIVGRPIAGAEVSGDDAAFVRRGDGLRLLVADGVGHGVPARAPASTAIEHLLRDADARDAMLRADGALEGTRGTVLGVVDLDELRDDATVLAIGNVDIRLVGDVSRKLTGEAGILGQRGRRPSLHREHLPVPRRTLISVTTDGLLSSLEIDRDDLVAQHPVVIAQRLLARFGRAHDDATVLIAR